MKEIKEIVPLGLRVAETIGRLVESGFEPPIYAYLLCPNGNTMFIRYSQTKEGLTPEKLSSCEFPGGYVLPINGMIVSSHGQRAWLLAKEPNEVQILKSEKDERVGYVSTGEAAKMLNISRSTVQRYVTKGILKGQTHPVTNWRSVSMKSVLALIAKYGIKVT